MTKENSPYTQWEEWNMQGFIPGPDESEANFEKRIVFCKNLEYHLQETTGDHFPFQINPEESKKILEEVLPFTQKLYGIQPHWVLIFFSNYQLAPWHGGCAWIFQLNELTPTSAFLQLRASFRHSLKFLGIYRRSELLAHELGHVGRMLYQEPQFEEMLAYQSSSSPWRRWLGPIVQSSRESFFFILLVGVAILANLALVIGSNAGVIMGWINVLPLLFIFLGLARLFYRHQIFNRCLQNLTKIYTIPKAKHLLYRLRDSEIVEWSRLSSSEIQEFIEKKSINNFRWRFLKTIYPFKDSC